MLDHTPDLDGPRDADDLNALDNALTDGGVDNSTRRGLLHRAGIGAAVVGAAGALGGTGTAFAQSGRRPSTAQLRTLASTIATSEAFGVTFLTQAIRQAPGTPSEQFTDVLKAANVAEFDHIRGLRRLGGRPLTERFWIPDALLATGGANVFAAIETLENVEISAYLLAVTQYARAGQATGARALAAAMGVESEHRALARFAQNALGRPVGVPDDRSHAAFPFRSLKQIQSAVARTGIGFGKEGAKPGRFYEFPGSPLANGTGLKTNTRLPQ